MTYTTATQDFVGQLKKRTAPGPEFALRLATVHSVGVGGELMVKLGNDPMPLPARHLGSYDPVVGDPVQLMVYGQDMVVMGSTKRGQVIPEERDFTTNPITIDEIDPEALPDGRDFASNPIQWNELDPDLHPRDFEASPILEFELAPVLWPRDFGNNPIGIGEVMSDLIPRNFGVNPIDINEVTAPLLPRNFVVNPIIHDELAYEAVKRENILDGAVSRIKIAEAAINAALIDTGAITETKISNNAVTTLKIASNSIITSHLQARQIEANHIKGGAITAFEIAGLTITGDKISANTITAAKIQTNTIAVDTAFLNALQVGTAQIVNGSITNAKISTLVGDRIAANKIVTENIVVTNAMIENGAITDAKISSLAANKISASKIGAGSITASTITLGTNGIITIGSGGAISVGNTVNGVRFDSTGIKMYSGGSIAVNIPAGGSPSFSGNITGGTINIGNFAFQVTSSGAMHADYGTLGTIEFYDMGAAEAHISVPTNKSLYISAMGAGRSINLQSNLLTCSAPLGTWTSLTNAQLGANWNNFGSDFGNVRYKQFGDLLFITGFVSTTVSASTTIFTLPLGMRPATRQTFACFRTGTTAPTRVDVQTDGQVVKVDTGAMNISLAGIVVHL